MTERAVMVLGCTSGAGKSWIATALCRWYAREGLRVAPFKAQNMSNHARVVATPDGGSGEIGSAQYFQALAAGIRPSVLMNPVLLKPEADTRSQVVVAGRRDDALGAMGWRERGPLLWDHARRAYDRLRADVALVVIEGAGSPAEINLADVDFVNTGIAVHSGAACLLVADIDRGGAFAHLHGTCELMDPRVRAQLRGFLLNRFRGDAALLAPGPALLARATGLPTLGVIPMLRDHGLPEEDAVPASAADARVVVVCGPHASNLDEFEALRSAGVGVAFVHDAACFDACFDACAAAARAGAATSGRLPALLVLPGSKNTRGDLAWLRRSGLDRRIADWVATGLPTLAVCGGLQIAGRAIADPAGRDAGAGGHDRGLDLLALQTRFDPRPASPPKAVRRTRARFGALDGVWSALAGARVDGYEIHAGESAADATGQPPVPALHDEDGAVLGWQQGNLLALYLHGVLESAPLVERLFGLRPPALDGVFDRLADAVEAAVGADALRALLR